MAVKKKQNNNYGVAIKSASSSITTIEHVQPWWQKKLYQLFGADIRSLALLRVGVGALLLADLINRSKDLVAHYSDFGVLPRQALLDLASNPWYFSFHSISGAWEIQALLFIIAGIFAVSLILGYKTRLSTIVSFILLISLQNRNPIILHNSDTLIRVTLFWCMFLPWGKYFSLDSALKPHEAGAKGPISSSGKQIISLATVGYLVQMMLVYIFAAMFKSGPDWHADGTAIYYALSQEAFTRDLGYFMLQYPTLMAWSTHAVLWFETIGPWLLIIPFGTTFFRSAAVLGFVGLHAGIGLTMHLGMFPWISAIVTLGLLPTGFWNWLGQLRERWRQWRQHHGYKISGQPTIYYDSECGFCQNAAHLIKTFLLLDKVEIKSAQASPKILKLMLENNSWVIEDSSGGLHLKFNGFIALVTSSPLFWPLKYLFDNPLVRPIGTRIYEYIASHRTVACSLEPPQRPRTHKDHFAWFIKNGLAGFFIIYILMWNISTLPATSFSTGSSYRFPQRLAWIGQLLRLDQMWNMFSPTPPHEDGWYVIPGQLTDGRSVDVFQDVIIKDANAAVAPPDFAKPARVSDSYPDYRWQKYLMNMANSSYKNYRLYFGRYLCRAWNAKYGGANGIADGNNNASGNYNASAGAGFNTSNYNTGPDALESFEIFYVQEWTQPPSGTTPDSHIKSPAQPVSLWQHECF